MMTKQDEKISAMKDELISLLMVIVSHVQTGELCVLLGPQITNLNSTMD